MPDFLRFNLADLVAIALGLAGIALTGSAVTINIGGGILC
jgi:hypothetical protein